MTMISSSSAFYAKRCARNRPVSSALPPLLYIDRHLSLPSKCQDSHFDGWGEGFEQREIKVDDGELCLSFWDNSDRFFIKPEDELKGSQSFGFGMTM